MSELQNGKEHTYVNEHHDHGEVEGQPKMPELNRQVSVQFSPEQFAEMYLQPDIRSGKQLQSLKS